MAITVSAPTSFGGQGLGSGTFDITWTNIAISTNGWVFAVIFGGGGATLTLNSFSLSTDGALTGTSNLKRDDDTQGRFFQLNDSTAATQTATASFSNGNNAGAVQLIGWEITGTYDTSDIIGATATLTGDAPLSALDLTTGTANAAIIALLQGGGNEVGQSVTSSGLTFVSTDNENAQRRSWSARCQDAGAAGTKSLSASDGDWFYAVEIKAASSPFAGDEGEWSPSFDRSQPPLVSMW